MNGFDRSKYVNRLFDCLRGINRCLALQGFDRAQWRREREEEEKDEKRCALLL
jgi:hypothetical protein